MYQAFIYITLCILGAGFGSFAGAQVWRLRAKQLVEDAEAGEAVDDQEMHRLRPLTQQSITSDRSRCLSCGHILAWYDLVPFISWLSTRGKCRYCQAPIGTFEPLMEIGVASAFVLSYLLWPVPLDNGLAVAAFGVWLVAVVLLAILFAYDQKWFLLPDSIVFPFIAVSAVFAIMKVVDSPEPVFMLISIGGAVVVLSGLYYLLWFASKGQWVGFGDVKLGLGLALLLADWRLALLALFLANLIGTLIVVPAMALGRVGRKTQVPFGPLLIVGASIALLVGDRLIQLYLNAFL